MCINNVVYFFKKIENLLLDGSLNDYEFVKNSNKNIDDVDDANEFKDLCVRFLFNNDSYLDLYI